MIAIIALLVSILLPSLVQVKKMGQLLKCSTNLHAIGRAAQMYSSDNDGFLPRDCSPDANSFYTDGNPHWGARFAEYLGYQPIPPDWDVQQDRWPDVSDRFERMDVLHCPALADSDKVLHYVVNARRYSGSGPNYAGPTRARDLPGAGADILYIAEANVPGRPYVRDRLDLWDLFGEGHLPFGSDGVPNDNPRMIHAQDARHDDKTPLLFYDSHVSTPRLHPDDLPVRLLDPELEG